MTRLPQFRQVLRDQLSDYVTAIAWSPDHRIFAISAAGELTQWQMEANHWRRTNLLACHSETSNSPSSALSALQLSSDGQFLACSGQSGTLSIYDISKTPAAVLQTHTFQSAWIDQLAWHPLEPILAVGVGREVVLWRCPQMEPFRRLNFESSSVLTLAWHPQGECLAVGGQGGVKIWDLETQETPELLAVPGASLCTAWSPDGKFIASGNLDRTLSVMDYGHPPPWLMQGFPSKVSSIAWTSSPRKQNILAAVASDGITVWTQSADLSWQNTVLTGHQGFIRDVAFQPNSMLLASGGNEGKVRLWKAGKKLQRSLKGALEGTHCLRWNHTGTRLALGGIDGSVVIFELEDAGRGFG